LIERLYREGIENGRLLEQSAEPPMPSAQAEEEASETARLQQVMEEMGSMLQRDDQPDMEAVAPDEAACLRILNHWEQMMQSANGLRQHMQSLEQDIVKMQPWGNFDVMKVDELACQGCHIRFWKMPTHILAQRVADGCWQDCLMQVVANETGLSHYVTVTMDDEEPIIPAEAQEVEICPCPVSTLIMLQTRDKDSLRKLETLQGDYALCHYGEVVNALRQALPEGTPLPQRPSERIGLRQRIHSILKWQH